MDWDGECWHGQPGTQRLSHRAATSCRRVLHERHRARDRDPGAHGTESDRRAASTGASSRSSRAAPSRSSTAARRRGAAAALDLRLAASAAVPPRARAPTCGSSRSTCPTVRASSTSSRSSSGGEHRLIQDPLNAQRRARSVRRRTRSSARAGLHGAGLDAARSRGAAGRDRRARDRDSAAFGGSARCQVYLPARFRPSRRYPLLIVHDGEDYLRFAGLKTVLDNLIHRLEIPPMIVALIAVAGPPERVRRRPAPRDVPGRGAGAPARSARFRSSTRPSARGLCGRSFGAVASLAAAWRHQGVFGNLLLQSGSFAFTDIGKHDRGPVFDPVVRFVNAFRKQPGQPARPVVPLLRRVRVADLLQPLARAVPAEERHGRALRRGARRPQLGELARPAARGAFVAVPGAVVDGVRVGPRSQRYTRSARVRARLIGQTFRRAKGRQHP